MRKAEGYELTAESGAFGAGALYVLVENMGAAPIIVAFAGAETKPVLIKPGKLREFPFLGAQGYEKFTVSNDVSGPVEAASVIIIQ